MTREKPLSFRVISETSDWICVEKPACWLSVPSREKNELRPVVGTTLQAELGIQIYPVHRLDYEVSGLLIFAKNKRTQSFLNSEFERHQVKKTYLALTDQPRQIKDAYFEKVHQSLPANFQELPMMEWTCQLVRGKRRAFEAPHGKRSVTQARIFDVQQQGEWSNPGAQQAIFKERLKLYQNAALAWELSPLTGRSHQLRYEMYRHGCPILGDVLYGGASPESLNSKHGSVDEQGIALCHFQIQSKSLGILRLF